MKTKVTAKLICVLFSPMQKVGFLMTRLNFVRLKYYMYICLKFTPVIGIVYLFDFQVIIGTLASYFGKFHDKFHMKVVGNVPAGYCIYLHFNPYKPGLLLMGHRQTE